MRSATSGFGPVLLRCSEDQRLVSLRHEDRAVFGEQPHLSLLERVVPTIRWTVPAGVAEGRRDPPLALELRPADAAMSQQLVGERVRLCDGLSLVARYIVDGGPIASGPVGQVLRGARVRTCCVSSRSASTMSAAGLTSRTRRALCTAYMFSALTTPCRRLAPGRGVGPSACSPRPAVSSSADAAVFTAVKSHSGCEPAPIDRQPQDVGPCVVADDVEVVGASIPFCQVQEETINVASGRRATRRWARRCPTRRREATLLRGLGA